LAVAHRRFGATYRSHLQDRTVFRPKTQWVQQFPLRVHISVYLDRRIQMYCEFASELTAPLSRPQNQLNALYNTAQNVLHIHTFLRTSELACLAQQYARWTISRGPSAPNSSPRYQTHATMSVEASGSLRKKRLPEVECTIARFCCNTLN